MDLLDFQGRQVQLEQLAQQDLWESLEYKEVQDDLAFQDFLAAPVILVDKEHQVYLVVRDYKELLDRKEVRVLQDHVGNKVHQDQMALQAPLEVQEGRDFPEVQVPQAPVE